MTIIITCPSCKVSNKLPDSRLHDKPRCGKCHSALFSGQPVELDAGSLSAYVEKNQTPLLVDFWAPWCGPCKQMAPEIDKAAQNLEPAVRVAKLNTEDHPAVAAQFGIRGIPTMILFHHGKEVDRRSGAISEAEIVKWVDTVASAS